MQEEGRNDRNHKLEKANHAYLTLPAKWFASVGWTLLDLSYSTRRVTRQEIEPGVHAVVVPASCRKETNKDLVEVEVRVASSHVPGMARGVRLALERLGEFALTLPADYRGWMGAWGKDIAAGETQVTVFVDLAYLEAALLARLWDHGVLVEFGSPLAFFRRGALTDYANIYEGVVAMVAEGRSLADTADQLAPEILGRLQLYANAYLQLSSLYTQAAWHIDRDNFVVKVPGSRLSLVLQYWELRGDHTWGRKSCTAGAAALRNSCNRQSPVRMSISPNRLPPDPAIEIPSAICSNLRYNP